ncbi:helix-turn-helix transcriptional regulator [Blastococcus sp. MG754426]|uniref:Helix-turn-helix domain-containing protein n=2 Tax=Geodermatophilaceae TaxID=85030 RepID=A0A285VGE0_9ACTN|nr:MULTISPECIES: helix-turn-helix transcriptional regulator [Geodermatophilaceae]MCF6506720.1 helix-turn-helix transcriptional regulator [Blastococcus sp. MG754426]MCF6511531.1 helix-turn-helix transcriptional regulator [Blastococcus sp. MG754427]SOC53043.1 Helix-turn-helix domain-containing protein [Blastococcus aggregatus]
MARPLLRGDRLQAAREAIGLSREELAENLELSSPVRIRVWETGLERPRPRFVPRLATALGVDPLYLLDVDRDDPPLAALRLAAGFATNEVTGPGLSVMTYLRLEDGRPGADPSPEVIAAISQVLGVDSPRVEAAVRRSRRDHAAMATFEG